ncbi:MAG: NAD(P)-binding domain-containing protein [Polyangiaceae bacterium]|nr:NAD(P)-binding domain-containing protein [Polyangiaceae bacterium]
MTESSGAEHYDALVIGAGAAGVGVAVALKDAGVKKFAVLERHFIGSSFAVWPIETRFITPSFPTNSIGMLDLNAVALGTSPAHILGVEHPTGQEYAAHLNAVARHHELPIQEDVSVQSVSRQGGLYHLETSQGRKTAQHLVWAAGEFQFPATDIFPGSRLCTHTSDVASFRELRGEDFVVIGGYESGIDAAFHLAQRGARVRVLDRGCPWANVSSDPSIALSTYSLERMADPLFEKNVQLHPEVTVSEVQQTKEGFLLKSSNGKLWETPQPPLLAAGYLGGLKLVSKLFEHREDGFPLLSEEDESTTSPGLFLCGPAVRHDKHVFCFIYKYRQRFAVVAKAIATALELPAEALETYRQWGMYLDDLSCCGEECVC